MIRDRNVRPVAFDQSAVGKSAAVEMQVQRTRGRSPIVPPTLTSIELPPSSILPFTVRWSPVQHGPRRSRCAALCGHHHYGCGRGGRGSTRRHHSGPTAVGQNQCIPRQTETPFQVVRIPPKSRKQQHDQQFFPPQFLFARQQGTQ